MPSAASPIADLTYRNYDGPLNPPVYRWWPIARMTMRYAFKKRGFWGWGLLSAWWYFVMAIVFYVTDLTATTPAVEETFFKRIVWKDVFLNSFSNSQVFLLFLALLIGVGTIANDMRANALLVYLSKPCTKADYLIGKWLGIFLPLCLIVGAPMLLFFSYCALSYRQYGVISDDPWLILQLLAIIPIAPAFHASVSLGISSMFDQGRTAGALYGGIYFMTLIFTKFIGAARVFSDQTSRFVDTAFYFSIDGIQIGLAKDVLGTDGASFFRRINAPLPPPAPNWILFAFIYVAVCAVALGIAWSRVKAVEVVSS